MSLENAAVIKFDGANCSATSCGSKNSVAAMMAMAILSGSNSGLQVAQAHEVAAQSVGNAAREAGIQLG